MSIMFADIRSFTKQIEQKNSAEAFEYINAFLALMEVQIHRHGGFINQYLGDGVMALFDLNSDAAVRAGIDMLKAIPEHNRVRRGLDAFDTRIGIGLSSGDLMLGTIGGEERLDSGVVGDAVNVAARIESLTKVYGADLLISDTVYRSLDDPSRYQIRVLDTVMLKGKSEPVTIYEVMDGLPSDVRKQKLVTQRRFAEGQACLESGDLARAEVCFNDCLTACPTDLAAQIHLQRCRARGEPEPPS